jgi:hypothetical protein
MALTCVLRIKPLVPHFVSAFLPWAISRVRVEALKVEQRHLGGLMEIWECILVAQLLRGTGAFPTAPVGSPAADVVQIELSRHLVAKVEASRTQALSLSAYQ